MENQDVADILRNLPAVGADDTARRLLDLYARVMEVYEPSERTVQLAREAETAVIRYSATANYITSR